MNNAESPSVRHPARGFTAIEVLVVIAVVGLLLAIVLPALQIARESSRRLQCVNSLRTIALGVQQYLAETQYFPPIVTRTDLGPGAPGVSAHSYSPLVRMLPYLEQSALYFSTNLSLIPELGDGVVQNFTVMTTAITGFLCPSDAGSAVSGFGRTNYRFSIGPTHTLAPGSRKPESFLGPFTTHRVYAAADFHDGLTNTLGVSERLQGDWLNGVGKPGGDYPMLSPPSRLVLESSTALNLCAASQRSQVVESRGGESWFLSGLHFTNFNHCATPNRTDVTCSLENRNETLHERLTLSGVFPPSSCHTGGVNAGMMDGSVRFIRNSIHVEIWRAVGTRSAGEAVDPGDL